MYHPKSNVSPWRVSHLRIRVIHQKDKIYHLFILGMASISPQVGLRISLDICQNIDHHQQQLQDHHHRRQLVLSRERREKINRVHHLSLSKNQLSISLHLIPVNTYRSRHLIKKKVKKFLVPKHQSATLAAGTHQLSP